MAGAQGETARPGFLRVEGCCSRRVAAVALEKNITFREVELFVREQVNCTSGDEVIWVNASWQF